MRVLLKYPTRERPEQFIENIKKWESMLSPSNEYHWLITIDQDDPSMGFLINDRSMLTHPHTVVTMEPAGKIAACNFGVNEILETHHFDMIWLVSDDMKPMIQDFDVEIEYEMNTHYPDYDGAVHINDGLQGIRLCTFSCMGVPYYKRYGYLYHPDYKSTHCDDEYTQLAWAHRRMLWIPTCLVKHEWVGLSKNPDALHKKNHALMTSVDQETYNKRIRSGFPKNSIL
ncbi:MAG: hypothetical protein NWQ24_12685 [Haliea sp.]|nr:hypothetical protein [Haliea sp.]